MKKDKAFEFVVSERGQYIISQALCLGIDKLNEVQPDVMREKSNIADMEFLVENMFPIFAATRSIVKKSEEAFKEELKTSPKYNKVKESEL